MVESFQELFSIGKKAIHGEWGYIQLDVIIAKSQEISYIMVCTSKEVQLSISG